MLILPVLLIICTNKDTLDAAVEYDYAVVKTYPNYPKEDVVITHDNEKDVWQHLHTQVHGNPHIHVPDVHDHHRAGFENVEQEISEDWEALNSEPDADDEVDQENSSQLLVDSVQSHTINHPLDTAKEDHRVHPGYTDHHTDHVIIQPIHLDSQESAVILPHKDVHVIEEEGIIPVQDLESTNEIIHHDDVIDAGAYHHDEILHLDTNKDGYAISNQATNTHYEAPNVHTDTNEHLQTAVSSDDIVTHQDTKTLVENGDNSQYLKLHSLTQGSGVNGKLQNATIVKVTSTTSDNGNAGSAKNSANAKLKANVTISNYAIISAAKDQGHGDVKKIQVPFVEVIDKKHPNGAIQVQDKNLNADNFKGIPEAVVEALDEELHQLHGHLIAAKNAEKKQSSEEEKSEGDNQVDINIFYHDTKPKKRKRRRRSKEAWRKLQTIDPDVYYDCKDTDLGREYRGRTFVTSSGKMCQPWKSQHPHKHRFTPANFPGVGLEENYCRNPNNYTKGPWCFTMDKSKMFEHCSIEKCSECLRSQLGVEYKGTRNYTASGVPCQKWSEKFIHLNKYLKHFPNSSLEENYCRNPDSRVSPWCVTSDTVSHKVQLCDIPKCQKLTRNCRLTSLGTEYRGTWNKTVQGKECLHWNKINGRFKPSNIYPMLEKNYCRNPGNDKSGLWCYFYITGTKKLDWDICSVPLCEDCWDGVSPYLGSVSVTKSGRLCQKWNTSYPHRHRYRILKNYGLRENYCSNPNAFPGGPWCYTQDPGTRVEECQIPKCSHA